MASRQFQVSEVSVSQLKAASIGYNEGEGIHYNIVNATEDGKLASVTCLKGPTADGVLVIAVQKCRRELKYKVTLVTHVSSSGPQQYSVLMYNVGIEQSVSVPNLKHPLQLCGPSTILVGEDMYTYDGKTLSTYKKIVPDKSPINIFAAGKSIIIQTQRHRNTVKLPPSVTESSQATIVGCFNLPVSDQFQGTSHRVQSKTDSKL